MANITKAERERREAETRDNAKYTTEFPDMSGSVREEVEARNAIDERLPDRRPATISNPDTGETFRDDREFSDTLAKAVNQMAGRAAITENHDPHPLVTAIESPPIVQNPNGMFEGKGEEVQLLKGYVPMQGAVIGPTGQGEKRLPGEVIRLDGKELKRAINLGIAKFVDVD